MGPDPWLRGHEVRRTGHEVRPQTLGHRAPAGGAHPVRPHGWLKGPADPAGVRGQQSTPPGRGAPHGGTDDSKPARRVPTRCPPEGTLPRTRLLHEAHPAPTGSESDLLKTAWK